MKKTINQNKSYFNLTNLFLLAYLLIDLLPTFNGKFHLTSIQYLYVNFVNICCIFYFYKNPNVYEKIKFSHTLRVISILYFLYLFLCLLSLFGSSNFSVSIISLSKIIVFAIVGLNMFILFQNAKDIFKTIVIAVSIICFLECFLALYCFIRDFYASNVGIAIAKLNLNMGNINLFGASLIVKIPFLILGLLSFDKWKKFLFSILLLMAFTSVYLTSSRACYISLGFSVMVFVIYTFTVKNTFITNFKSILYVILPFLLGVFFSNLALKKVTNSVRTKDVVSRVVQITDKTDSSRNVRLIFWENAFQMAKENPFFGVGLGNYMIESIPFEKNFSNDSKVSINAHNDFLEVTAETGFVSGIIYFLLFVAIGIFNLIHFIRSKNQESKTNSVILIMLLFAYFIDAFFNFPLYKPSMQLYFVILMVLTILNYDKDCPATSISNFKSKLVLIGILSLTTLYFVCANFQASILDFANKKSLFFKENLSSDFVLNNFPDFPNVSYNSEPFFQLLGVAYYNENNYEKALPYFKKAHQINPYLGHSDWYHYKIFQNQKNKDSAFFYAKRAFEARPRNHDFYLDYIQASVQKLDTTTILEIHKTYTSRRNNPTIWTNTGYALASCNYSKSNLLKFVNEGLEIFSTDEGLLTQKDRFITDSKKTKITKEIAENFNSIIENAKKVCEAGNFTKGIEYYKKAIDLQPNDAVLYQNLGLCYFKLNQAQPAIKYFTKSLSFNTLQDGKSEFLLGVCYLYLNDKNISCNYFQISKNKNNFDADAMIKKYCNPQSN